MEETRWGKEIVDCKRRNTTPKYSEVEILSGGGNGNAFLIKDSENEAFYILKVAKLDKDYTRGPDGLEYKTALFRQIFEEEKQLRAFRNPILKVYESYPQREQDIECCEAASEFPWIIMDYVPGCSLYGLTGLLYKNSRYLTPFYKYKIIYGIIVQLEKLHKNKIYHRDLKPQNILLNGDLDPEIADFGEASSHVVTERKHGTINFTAPEIIRVLDTPAKKPCNEKTDIYSLGGIIVSIISNEFPFMECETIDDIKSHISKGEIDDSFRERGSILDEDCDLYELYKTCCNEDPNERLALTEIKDIIVSKAQEYITDQDELKKFNSYVEGEEEEEEEEYEENDEPTGNRENIKKAVENGLHFAPDDVDASVENNITNTALIKAAKMLNIEVSMDYNDEIYNKFSKVQQ